MAVDIHPDILPEGYEIKATSSRTGDLNFEVLYKGTSVEYAPLRFVKAPDIDNDAVVQKVINELAFAVENVLDPARLRREAAEERARAINDHQA